MIDTKDSGLPTEASWGRVLRDQKKIEIVAASMMVAAGWIGFVVGWRLSACIAIGVLLGLANHLATEHWLLKVITSGGEPTRAQMTRSTMVRLGVLAVVAVGAAVALWPDGIGLLLGLAIFRLVALLMTTIPLLKELRNP